MDCEAALNTCSAEIQAAIKWLEEHVKFDREKLENRLKGEDREWAKEDISRRLAAKYLCCDAIVFYALSKVNSPLVNDFLEAAKSEKFWVGDINVLGFDAHLSDKPELFWCLSKLGLNKNVYFKKALEVFLKKQQTLEGKIPIEPGFDASHLLALRILASVEPNSETTNMAFRYCLGNLDEFKSLPYRSDVNALPEGVLALCQLDYLKFRENIEDLGHCLKSKQNDESYWKDIELIETTSAAIEALSRVFGPNDESVIRAVEWLKSNRKEDGSWGSLNDTAFACLALMSVGEGPKVPLAEIEWNERLKKQTLERIKPSFVQTSPNLGVTEIKEKIREMLNNANERIWICSRFITEFWTTIITLKQEKPHLDVRIVTHPITGKNKARYEGDGRKFVEPAFSALQRLLGKNFKTQPLLHARLYIVDNEVLISSADITAEQLEKEFNAGIWTRDKETIEEAVKFFENLWKESGS